MQSMIEWVALAIEAAGVIAMVLGILLATGRAARGMMERRTRREIYDGYRAGVGRSILLGLEFLVAADIIQTILIEPTLARAAALGLIVLIRTFLSFSLETEIEGRFPWRQTSGT